MCVCEHRVTYWVFAKSFSPQKKFVKKLSVVAGDSMNDFCQKKMTKFASLQRGHKFSSCEKFKCFHYYWYFIHDFLNFFCNNLFPLSLIISYFIISICKNVLKRFIITHLCNDFSWCNYSILHTCELFTKFF